MFTKDAEEGYEKLLDEEPLKMGKRKSFWKRLSNRKKGSRDSITTSGHPFVFRTRKNPDFIIKGRLERITLDPAVTFCKPEDVGNILEILRFIDRSLHSWDCQDQIQQNFRVNVPEKWSKKQLTNHLDALFRKCLIVSFEITGMGQAWVDATATIVNKSELNPRPINGL